MFVGTADLWEKKKGSPNSSKKKPALGLSCLSIGPAAAIVSGYSPLFGKRKPPSRALPKETDIGLLRSIGRTGGSKCDRPKAGEEYGLVT